MTFLDQARTARVNERLAQHEARPTEGNVSVCDECQGTIWLSNQRGWLHFEKGLDR